MPRITVIEPTIDASTNLPILNSIKRRVAAYARVSTDSDEQYTSYEAQVEHYTKYIKERTDWEYVDTYADEGISGTYLKRREAFNKMIADALSGKIDLIITKSISRVARNILDTIQKVRELKAHHVEVFFEKENIWTFDSKSELIMTIMASIAQEESRSISENVKWGKKVAYQNGKVTIAYSSFLGYKKGEDGRIEIDETQAPLVREIYRLFLFEGYTAHSIAQHFNKLGIKTVMGSKKWSKNGVLSILTNEKYKGDALLQKGYVPNYLDHKVVKNNGELPKYYVENSHPAIIDRAEWDMVQAEIQRRNEIGAIYSSNDIFSSKLICEDCGSFYGRKVWHSNDAYRRVIYQCNHKFDSNNSHKCMTPHLTEEEIKNKFMLAYNEVMTDKEKIIDDLKEVAELLGCQEELDSKISEAKLELEVVENMVSSLIEKRTKTDTISEEEFEKQYKALEDKSKQITTKIGNLMNEKTIRRGKKAKILASVGLMEKEPNLILKWNKEAWMAMVESAIVHKDKTISFRFYCGRKVKV